MIDREAIPATFSAADGSGKTSDEFNEVVRWLRSRPFEADTATIDTLRERFEDLAAHFHAPPATVFELTSADGVPVEWARAATAQSEGCILYLHGGGYAIGSIRAYGDLCARISAATEMPVLSVGYRLAPEHPFPAAIDDALIAYRWLLAQGVPAAKIVVAGDSAGGGLAMSLLLDVRDQGLPCPAGGVLFSPLVDLAHEGRSMATRADEDPIVTPAGSHSYAVRYLPEGDYRNPRASALYADLHRLPPILIQVGTAEVLLDDALRLARRLRLASSPVELDVWPEMIHIWPFFASRVPESRIAIEGAAEFIGRVVYRGPENSTIG